MSRPITSSQLAQVTLILKGQKFGFKLHLPFREIYDWPKKRIILKTARQVGKSTFLSAFALTNSARNNHYRTFYASTSETQAKEFSRIKLSELLNRSPRLRRILFNPKGQGELNDSVFSKNFSNGSGITISYMRDDADRTRGYSADALMLDEVQDMDPNEIPVVEEILSASLDPSRFYTGTPKTMDNHIEYRWSQSTMHEVFFRCSGCGKFNSIGYKSIGKRGPICTSCGGNLDITKPHLIPTYDKEGKEPYYIGARIPQPALLLHSGYPEKWKDLLFKYETYDEAKFMNEVLGISHSAGIRFVTESDIIEQCTGLPALTVPNDRLFNIYDLFIMGIDWTGDGVNNVSKNAAVIYGRVANDPRRRLQIVYKKVWPRQDFMKTMEEMVMVANMFRVTLIGADAGEGALNNAYLATHLGANRIQPFRYGAFDLPARLSKDKRTVYLDKTQALDDFFMHFKQGQFILPPFETFQEESKHILSLFEVVTRAGRRVYSHSPAAPDDFTHAMAFGYNAYKLAAGQLKFY